MKFLRVFCAVLLLGLAVSEENTGCPTLSVSPCTCTNTPLPVLKCDKVKNSNDLRDVFLNSAGTRYHLVRFTNSVFQYIPHEMFDGVEVQELQFFNGTLAALFNKTPKDASSLHTLKIGNTRIMRDFSWKLLQSMTHLRVLNISSSKIRVLGSEFIQYAPKSLEEISFNDTKTRKIEAGVFGHFPNLEKVVFDHTQLRELKRNIFPVPFNGRYVSFNENQLTSLPADMFSDMPNLRALSLRGNSLTTLPPYPFENLHFLNLEGNPINCDCDLAWIADYEFMVLKGTCASPESLQGRKLKDVYKNMSCM